MHIRRLLFLLCIINTSVSSHEGTATHLEQLNHAIEHAPDNQALYLQRGALYSEEAGLHERALQDFRHAERLGPAILVAYEIGLMFYRQGDFVQAQQYLDRYIAHFPQLAQPYEERAKILYELGKIEASLADYDRYFNLQPNINPGSFITAAKIHAAEATPEAIAAALRLLDQGIETLGLNPQLQRYAIELELQQRRPAQALARLTTLKAVLKASPLWQIEMAELLLQSQQPAEAKAFLTQADVELAQLKQTPARLQLRQRIQQLQTQIIVK